LTQQEPEIPLLLPAGPGALEKLWSGHCHGLSLPGLFSMAELAELQHTVKLRLPERHAQPFPGTTFGSVLIVTEDRQRYFQDARALRQLLEERGLLQRLRTALSELAGHPVQTPEEDGKPYAEVTIRRLPAGQEVAVHSERWEWPAMAWHRQQLQPRWHLSFYLPMNPLADGGELELFHRPLKGIELGGLSSEQARQRLEIYGYSCWKPLPGELLIFDGGRFNHRVCPSTDERWTLGGFAGRDRDGQLWIWS
jgi:2OG-Fe(II) oxygenase superfamily